MIIQDIIFYFFGILSVVFAFLVIMQKNVMHSILYLAFTILSISGVFFTLQAEFLGAVQILVYAGGIVVLYLFVIIIVNMSEIKKDKRRIFPKFFIIILSLLFLTEIIYVIAKNQIVMKAGPETGLDIKTFAAVLLSKYIIPFEIASILLLAVIIGAIVIARRKLINDTN